MTRYVVGIDLGTTNTVVAYADTAAKSPKVEVFEVPQLTAAGEVRERPTLPSAIYLPAGPELAKGALALPWDRKAKTAVGTFARDQGAEVPSRLVSSAKSWLCHAGVDRRGPVLPWGAEGDVSKISPLEAQAAILRHIVAAWNDSLAPSNTATLETQEVYLCVPASFDPAARELTLEAARAAGLEHVTLLEEPQAAFYAWLDREGERWQERLAKGDVVLVCDVGGGTTDLSLIAVGEDEAGSLGLERIAIGEHLLLGGDNMDLALAHVVAFRLEGDLDAWQTRTLWHACRRAKEALFEDPSSEEVTVAIAGRGAKLVGGAVRGTLSQEDLKTIAVDGFFPRCAAGDRPARAKRGGFQELGLPFVADPAVTKHLAAFLGRHAPGRAPSPSGEGRGEGPEGSHETGRARPAAVLFNGGVMKAAVLRERVRSLLAEWAGAPVNELAAADLDLAVALGAAYYGLVRRGKGIRIRGGVARSYYIGIESALPAVPGMAAPLKALCVVPFGMEEGTEVSIEGREFGLLTGEAAEFRFLGSTARKDDKPGDLLERVPEGVLELDPIEAHLEASEGRQETVPVTLKARLTEIGTLDLFCVAKDRDRAWKLEYNVRTSEE